MKFPAAQVLKFYPALTCSVWVDFESRARTVKGLEKILKRGVRDGDWVGWRLITVHKSVLGNP